MGAFHRPPHKYTEMTLLCDRLVTIKTHDKNQNAKKMKMCTCLSICYPDSFRGRMFFLNGAVCLFPIEIFDTTLCRLLSQQMVDGTFITALTFYWRFFLLTWSMAALFPIAVIWNGHVWHIDNKSLTKHWLCN